MWNSSGGMERRPCWTAWSVTNGLVYHYPGRLTGDYDVPETVEEILELIERGAGNP